MRSFLTVLGFMILLATAALGQSAQPAATATTSGAFDLSGMDRSIDPCVDFYQYACGNWMKNNPIPPDYASWDAFSQIYERNIAVLRQILEKASIETPERTPVTQKVGDFYASCMDESAANKKSYTPLEPELARIAAIKTKSEIIDTLAREHRLGSGALFNFNAAADFHDANMEIAFLDQGGLTLPDRDYYLKNDADMAAIRKAYGNYVRKIFTLIGETPAQASHSAEEVLRIETALAKASTDRTLRRDPLRQDHPMTVANIAAAAPHLHLQHYFATTGAPAFTTLNVNEPGFFRAIDRLVTDIPLTTWKKYLAWKMLHIYDSWLSDDFVQEDFKFEKTLSGQQQLPARWKRCVSLTDGELEEAVGQPYVEQTFGAEGKQRTLEMVNALEKALQSDISALPWMTEATRKQALLKLAAIRNKIGYPDQWRDYSKLQITRDDLYGNMVRSVEFETNRQWQKIGKPVDKSEWDTSPTTVNAFYSPERNEIVFPAGILQPPFFDRNMDDAVNLGGIGLIIGHELTHGFDDEGRKYDAAGNLSDWWTPQDAQEFEKRADCIAGEYGSFTAVDDLKLNGKLTLGENTADNGGAHISLMALHTLMAQTGQDPTARIDGYIPEQRYFLGFARSWCENITPEEVRVNTHSDPHSPSHWRIDGVLQNMPEFREAFHCKQGQPMVREPACRVW